jgi:hypothetical protein
MAKGESKVIIEENDDDDCDSDNDGNVLSYDDLVAIVIKSDDKLRMERSKLRDLEVKNVSLQNSFDELKTTHENLKISHETLNTSWGTLKEKHEELKEAHNSLLAQEVKGKMSMSVECNILDISPFTTNPSCSTSTSSCISEDMSCDSLLLENESLKEIECLSKDLARYFGSHVQFNHIWKKFTLEKNGLGYLPKKGKETFTPKEKIFVTSNVTYDEEEKVKMCHKCKAKVDVNHQCKSKKTVSLDPSYILKKDSKGVVCAKFTGRSLGSNKKKSIWVPKILVTNIEGPKKIWYLKQSNFFCR